MGRIRNLDKLQRRLLAMGGKRAERLIESALFAAADLIAGEAGNSITRGAVSGRNHVPSVAPNPPNNKSGVLANNIEVNRTARKEGGEIVVTVGSYAPYSAPLEFGASREFGTSRMSARPFMRPARDKMRKRAKRLVAEAVNKIVNGAVD